MAEIIAINIRNDEGIKGIKIDEMEFKINLMADDTTLLITSLSRAIERFEKFEILSGLKLNLNKTELIPIGNVKNKTITLVGKLSKI